MNGKLWTKQEDAALREHYAALGPSGCVAKLPGRTRPAITARAIMLGVARPKRNWTARERALIRDKYPALGPDGMHALIPHRSAKEIRGFASSIGVRLNSRRRPALAEATERELGALRDELANERAGRIAAELECERLRKQLNRARAILATTNETLAQETI